METETSLIIEGDLDDLDWWLSLSDAEQEELIINTLHKCLKGYFLGSETSNKKPVGLLPLSEHRKEAK